MQKWIMLVFIIWHKWLLMPNVSGGEPLQENIKIPKL
jgi:hypothetical protein